MKFRLGWPITRKRPRSSTPLTPLHDVDDLVASFFQQLQIIAVELYGQLAFDAADGFFHVVFDGLREIPDHAGNFVPVRVSMAAISASLSSPKTGRHFSLGLRSTKYSVLKKPVVSVPSSGRPTWETTTVTSGNEARTTRAWFMTRMPSEGPVLGARVPRTQMAPSSRCGRNSEPITPLNIKKAASARPATAMPTVNPAMFDRPTNSLAIVIDQEGHDRVVPFLYAFAEGDAGDTGAMSIEKIRAPSRAKATVQAMGLNKRPSTRCKVKMGM